MKKIIPKCHPKYNQQTKKYDAPEMSVIYTGMGYLLPCCLCNNHSGDDFEKLGMFDETLKIQNVDTITDIFKSKQWVNFHKIILTDWEKSPRVCKQKCSSDEF
jgi:hypothetical protein